MQKAPDRTDPGPFLFLRPRFQFALAYCSTLVGRISSYGTQS